MTSQILGPLQDFLADLERLSLHFPAADAHQQLIPPRRSKPCAHHWHWSDLERLLVSSAEFQTMLPQGQAGAERRILRLKNPAIAEETVTDTMSVSLQYLLPGEIARTHRHTPVAFRFFLRGSAHTTVEGERCDMVRGDLVITPFLEWHGHGNDTAEAAIWIDGLDYPLVRYLNSIVYEYADEAQQSTERTGLSDRRYGTVGLRPAWEDTDLFVERRSTIHFPWTTTSRYLNAMAAAGEATPWDDVIVEYVNPATGRSLFTTICCCIQLIRPGVSTRSHRHTSSAVYHVFEGEGSSVVGDERFAWGPGDFFVVPAATWHEHANPTSQPAILFSIQDSPTLKALGLYREESR